MGGQVTDRADPARGLPTAPCFYPCTAKYKPAVEEIQAVKKQNGYVREFGKFADGEHGMSPYEQLGDRFQRIAYTLSQGEGQAFLRKFILTVLGGWIKVCKNTTESLPSKVVAAGNPCRVLRAITDEDRTYYFRKQKFKEE